MAKQAPTPPWAKSVFARLRVDEGMAQELAVAYEQGLFDAFWDPRKEGLKKALACLLETERINETEFQNSFRVGRDLFRSGNWDELIAKGTPIVRLLRLCSITNHDVFKQGCPALTMFVSAWRRVISLMADERFSRVSEHWYMDREGLRHRCRKLLDGDEYLIAAIVCAGFLGTNLTKAVDAELQKKRWAENEKAWEKVRVTLQSTVTYEAASELLLECLNPIIVTRAISSNERYAIRSKSA